MLVSDPAPADGTDRGPSSQEGPLPARRWQWPGTTGDLAALLVIPAVVLAAYAAVLGRGFTSEDFLLIRYLGDHPPWRHLAEQLNSPWLGLHGIRFLRPLSTTIYAAEIALFGANPVGYNCVHVAVHALDAVLVYGVVRGLCGPGAVARRAAMAAGALFALHPLHPNAVIFTASFATLFGGTFFLGAVFAYLRFRHTDRRGWLALSLGAFACALLSYEAAAVLPLWLAAADHLGTPGTWRSHRRRTSGWLPFAGLLVTYLGWRLSVFGVVLGGYDATSQRLLGGTLTSLASDVAMSVQRLFVPYYGATIGPGAAVATAALLLVVPAGWLVWRGDRPSIGRWAIGWIWLLAALAPFGFQPMVPGDGRYAYLAVVGAVLTLAALFTTAGSAEVHSARNPRSLWAWPAALALLWGALLVSHLRAYAGAARTAQRIQQSLLAIDEEARQRPWFVTRYPYFVDAAGGAPVAQVYHYGLRDAVHPPFSRRTADVLPLPPLTGAELVPVLNGAGEGRVWEWISSGGLRPVVASPAATSLVELALIAEPTAGTSVPAALVRVPPGPHRRFRLLVSAPINGAVFDLPPGPRGDLLRVEMPLDFLRTSAHLYGPGRVYWWVEARDEAGALTGYTRMRPLIVAPRPPAFSR